VRVILGSLLLLGLTAGTAAADPRLGLAAAGGAPALGEIAPAARAPKPVRLTLRQLPTEPSLASLRFTSERVSSEPSEMPWIWQALRTKVYSQMPQRQTGGVTLVVSPVVVAGQYDTIPGLGIAGDF
jgi:hypothetical protein